MSRRQWKTLSRRWRAALQQVRPISRRWFSKRSIDTGRRCGPAVKHLEAVLEHGQGWGRNHAPDRERGPRSAPRTTAVRLEIWYCRQSPEARRGGDYRADVLLLSHAGKNLPIEAKRHYNRELWSAPLEQLAGYAADAGADGFGSTSSFGSAPSSRFRGQRWANTPSSAEALETMLRSDIPTRLQDKLAIVVLDVSRPATMVTTQARRGEKRSKKQEVR